MPVARGKNRKNIADRDFLSIGNRLSRVRLKMSTRL